MGLSGLQFPGASRQKPLLRGPTAASPRKLDGVFSCGHFESHAAILGFAAFWKAPIAWEYRFCI
jgi:hypothetical protein